MGQIKIGKESTLKRIRPLTAVTNNDTKIITDRNLNFIISNYNKSCVQLDKETCPCTKFPSDLIVLDFIIRAYKNISS